MDVWQDIHGSAGDWETKHNFELSYIYSYEYYHYWLSIKVKQL